MNSQTSHNVRTRFVCKCSYSVCVIYVSALYALGMVTIW